MADSKVTSKRTDTGLQSGIDSGDAPLLKPQAVLFESATYFTIVTLAAETLKHLSSLEKFIRLPFTPTRSPHHRPLGCVVAC